MKIFSLMIACLVAVSSFPQSSNVILKVNGHLNRKVVLDGRTFTMSNTNPKANNKNVTIADLQPGIHTIQVLRTKKATNTAVTSFNIRNGYDVVITVNGTGAVQVKEKRQSNVSTTTTQPAMSATAFNTLLQDVQGQ